MVVVYIQLADVPAVDFIASL